MLILTITLRKQRKYVHCIYSLSFIFIHDSFVEERFSIWLSLDPAVPTTCYIDLLIDLFILPSLVSFCSHWFLLISSLIVSFSSTSVSIQYLSHTFICLLFFLLQMCCDIKYSDVKYIDYVSCKQSSLKVNPAEAAA